MQRDFSALLESCRVSQIAPRSDSRSVQAGDIFVALPGSRADGNEFIAEAASRGARYIVCATSQAQAASAAAPDCSIVAVEDPRAALWQLARARWRADELNLKVIGVTGTNGKTTCAWLLERLFSSLGVTTGLLGTIEYHWPGFRQPASLTTPDALDLYSALASMAEAGVQTVIMEVSSHALAQQRVGGIDFAGAIFTNLTQDHLDFHKQMEAYFRSKAALFLKLPLEHKAIAINGDDRYGRRLAELLPSGLTFGLHKGMPRQKHLWGQLLSLTPEGMHLKMTHDRQSWELRTPLIGAFNASNLLAVQALALELGIDANQFKALESFTGVPGRLERVENDRGFHVFVDYAHTPDALINALRALRGAGFGRIVTVFGCGGNRDRDKRPLMGKAVAEYSDVAILTSDNPRMEEPEAIMRDVRPGLAKARQAIYEVDRKAATLRALRLLQAGDALLIAGKGHEDYQIIGQEKHHYSDQEVVRELLNCA